MEIAARHFDGKIATPRLVRLRRAPDGIEILPAAPDDPAPPRVWPFAEARIDRTAPDVQLHRVEAGEDHGERLVVPAAAFRALFGTDMTRFGRGRAGEISLRRLALWSGAAIASFLFLFFVGLPVFARHAAPLVPWRWEAAIGLQVERQVLDFFTDGKAPRLCGRPGGPGRAALERMAGRLMAGAELPGPLHVAVLDTAMTNAFALPGGRIFLFRPIIEKAGHPDEVAGVLAHEIGHVIHRDAMRGLISDATLSVLVGLVIGDITGGSTLAILSKALAGSAYSRENESEADRVSIALMRAAGADPRAINRFFRRIAPLDGDGRSLLDAFRSHPVTGERISAVEALAGAVPAATRPILDAADWAALKAICAEDRGGSG
ncbi:M48 family metallopeptidase [Rhabdaerophilum calidifontis]|uniref:M48 family metallopeptidase n=1 Tax=Rhabdaerophilum calidifontis TaxID=2604328 RepID=UPI00140DAED6|nr:M48 family metallopeptidase [Rhabdaerophilum calidifontis]